MLKNKIKIYRRFYGSKEVKELPVSMRRLLAEVKEKLSGDEKMFQIFENCYTNTLDTTVKKMEDGTTYVITGDIPAMWLRDSVCQLRPYLVLAKDDPEMIDLMQGLVERQFQFICIDPYANAFNEAPNGNCWEKDETDMDHGFGNVNMKLTRFVSLSNLHI